MLASTTPLTEQDAVSTPPSVTLEWIQSLPQQMKDAALYRLCKTIEAKPTLVESFTLNQVLYRTIKGKDEKFFESADNVAARTGCDRKTILKGLALAVEQNILEENKRPGTSNEYSFKPVEEWLPEPVRNKDIRTKKVIEFPSSQDTEPQETNPISSSQYEVVRETDDHETDTNNNIVVVNKLLEQQEQVSVPVEDTPTSSPWKYVGQGLPRVYMPPELDQETGSKIESIHEATQRPRQGIIKEAVDLLYNRLNRIPSLLEEKPKSALSLAAAATSPVAAPVVPSQKFSDLPTDDALAAAMRELRQLRIEDNATVRGMIKRLWHNFQGAYDSIKQRLERNEPFVNITGAFVNAMKNGDQPEVAVVVEQVLAPQPGVDEPNAEEMALIDSAIAAGRARDKYYGTHGWLVIRLSGHSEPWRDFLYK